MHHPGEKRIGIYINDLSGYGVSRRMLDLGVALYGKGYAIDLLTATQSGPLASEIPNGIRLIPVGGRRSRIKGFSTLGILKRLRDYITANRPHAMIGAPTTMSIHLLLVGLTFRSKPRVIASARINISCNLDVARGFARLFGILIPILYPHADKVVAVSEGCAEDLICHYKIPHERIKIIYNSVYSRELIKRSHKPIEEPGWTNGDCRKIIAIGRLHWTKDYDVLLKAFEIASRKVEAELILFGEGPNRTELERLAVDLGLSGRVRLPGFVSNPYPWLRRADLFVLSSRNEGLPSALIEAMACGCPVVATDCPSGPREILENGRWGRLVPVGDPEALAAAMVESLNSSHDRGALVERAKFFSEERMIAEYVKLLAG